MITHSNQQINNNINYFDGYDIYINGVAPQNLSMKQEQEIISLILICNDYERFKYYQ